MKEKTKIALLQTLAVIVLTFLMLAYIIVLTVVLGISGETRLMVDDAMFRDLK